MKKLQKLAIGVWLLLLAACSQLPPALPSEDKFRYLVPADSVPAFFGDTARLEAREWADKVLHCLKEPVLYTYAGHAEYIRFIWLPARKRPVVVRINRFGDTLYANIKQAYLDEDGFHPDKDTAVLIDVATWNDIITPLAAAEVWQRVPLDHSVKDGFCWILECRLGRKYYITEGWDSERSWLSMYFKWIFYLADQHVTYPLG